MLLFVCHANICRSPMAERLAVLALSGIDGSPRRARAGPLPVASAGTHARAGEGMHSGSAATLREFGAEPANFVSRQVSAGMIGQASLVLTATREQRAFCVRLAPVALRRTFTILQFGRLTATLDSVGPVATGPDGRSVTTGTAAAVAAVLAHIGQVRGELQPVAPDEDDLADPVNGTEADMRACAHRIQRSLRPALTFIATFTDAT